MTEIGYPSPEMGKRGPKPERGVAKAPYNTRLPAEQIAFLRSLDNAAGWLESKIDEQPEFVSFMRKLKRAAKKGEK